VTIGFPGRGFPTGRAGPEVQRAPRQGQLAGPSDDYPGSGVGPGSAAGAVVRGLVPSDVAADGAGCRDGDAWLDSDLVGVGFHSDLGGLAGVRQADLDLLTRSMGSSVAYQVKPPCRI